ncbi:hypothetical protein GCK32_020150 [Trichostrongylus colubriformis]|uniref:CCHC-type domain-containing protein n=1 Tax=Trichostrongylus colubriformis TaxID=6319 RepID=A0AAN8FF89_TRICO
MATISACKANLTKAHTSLEAARGKVPQELLNPFNNASMLPDDERQLLERRQEALRTHLTSMRAALRVVKERQQAFLAYVGNSGDKEVDNDAYVEYMQQSRVEESIVTAERLIHVLHANLEETCARSEHLRLRPADHARDNRQAQDDLPQEETHIHAQTNPSTQSPRSQIFLRDTPLRDAVDANSPTYASQQNQSQPSVQLGKLTLEPFTGDITQFQRFWRAFEIAVHDDSSISTTFKFLYLQGLLKGDAQIVLQDLDPDECNYYELVRALKKRYDRPHKTRAVLHKQLQQLPTASNSGTDLRNTWFRISGILRGLRKFEDFRTVLPILDLVRSKFPSEIQQKLHDFEFQSGADFDLHQIMHHLDNIIASREKYEDTTTLKDGYSVNNTSSQRTRSRSYSPQRNSSNCNFCGSGEHQTRNCTVNVPLDARINIATILGLCWRCLSHGHSRRNCRYPPCKRCSGDHHELLCRNGSRDDRRRRSPYRRDHYGSRRDDYRRNRRDYRSPSRDRYPSRSPSQDRYHHRRYTDSEHSRSPSWDSRRRDNSPRAYSPAKRQGRSPNRVTFRTSRKERAFHSPIRDTQSGWRTGSPHPNVFQHQAQDSDTELQQLNHCYQSRSVKHKVAKAALMLAKAKAYTHDTSSVEEVVLLLDSGAQNSFITTNAAHRLRLPIYDKKARTFLTFGGHETTEVTGVVDVELLDDSNRILKVHLTSKDTVTSHQVPPRLSDADIKFIRDNRLPIPSCTFSRPVLPDILIGIDNYWDVLLQEPPVCLPSDNKQLAYCRLVNQYQRLHKTPSAWQQYVNTIEDHLKAGFIEEVDEHVHDNHRVYYIPHQAVYKESSSTTKLRIVFDASSKTRGAPSLNDCLHQGPTLLPELAGILLRSRLCRFLLIADVEKAFHQIRLQRSQRDATRFLWLKNPFSPPSSANLRVFRFTRIPFGVNASPFMLAAAIQYYLRHLHSPLSEEIERNTYVDNVALGASTQAEAVQKYKTVKSVFSDMHMNLRQFVCNSRAVNDSISKDDRITTAERTSLLGIVWNYHSDLLLMTIKASDVPVHSKRTALRALASTYDPLGLLTPFLSNIKIFVQDLWAKQLAWDDPLDQSDLHRWSHLLADQSYAFSEMPPNVFTLAVPISSVDRRPL